MLFGCETFVSNILCGPNRVISIWRGSGGTRIMTVELESKAMVSMAPHTHSLPFFFSFRRQSHLLLIMYCRLSEPHTICRTFFCCVSSIRWFFPSALSKCDFSGAAIPIKLHNWHGTFILCID